MYKYLIILILLVSTFLRFYNLPNLFVFAGDEEHQAILAQSIVKDFHIIWVGVNAAHLGFYLGPYWVYFTSFWLMLSSGDPLITAYIAASIGIFTTLLVTFIGKELFGKKVGLLAGLLYASLPLIVFFDQKYWNPTPIPLLSLLMLFSLYKLKKNPKLLILFAACFGLIFHTHLSLFPIILIAIFWTLKEKIKLPRRIIILSAFIFIIMIAPLLAFDYFHKGSNITTPLRFNEITADYRNKINPGHHLQALFETLGRIWYFKSPTNNSDELITSCTNSSRIDNPSVAGISQRYNPPVALSLIGISILLAFLLNKQSWKKDSTKLLSLFILTIISSFLLFPGGAFEYYLLGLFPLLLFLPAVLADYFPRFKSLLILSIFVISVVGAVTVVANKPEFGLGSKKALINDVIPIINNQPFELKQTGICHFYEGWRYLFILSGKKPERSDSDNGLGWLYQEEITTNPVKYTVILSESRVPINFDIKNAKVFHQGGFSAYVFTNY